jgi:3-carboxy-cis,cis-muconate cycloisomerase
VSITPLDHPFLSSLLGDAELMTFFRGDWHLARMLEFEVKLAASEAAEGVIPAEAADRIRRDAARSELKFDHLRAGVQRDGVVVPTLIDQLRQTIAAPARPHLHHGATSQDVIDTVFAIAYRECIAVIAERLGALIAALDALAERDGSIEVMAHTRMQAAIKVPASRKILSWRDPLVRLAKQLPAVRKLVAVVHFAGAAGTLDKLGDKGPEVRARLARALGLADAPRPLHSERDGLAGFASWLSTVAGSLGKFGQDVALLAQSEVGEIALASGGGSSAMPHKVNPVTAEVLVAQARFCATLLPAMHHSLVHEYERSGAAWTLEWMVLPQMVMSTGSALRGALRLAGEISFRAGRTS